MTCDHCHLDVKAVYFIPGVPEGETWCEQCLGVASIPVRFELLQATRERERPVYERNMAAKHEASLQRLLFFKAEGRWPKRGELKKAEV